MEQVISVLQVDLLVPYSQLLLSSQTELPVSCLAFGLKTNLTWWYMFSKAEELQEIKTELAMLIQVSRNKRTVSYQFYNTVDLSSI